MTTWEYKIIDASGEFRMGGNTRIMETDKVTEALNKLGSEEWELISVRYDDDGMIHRAIFKRQLRRDAYTFDELLTAFRVANSDK